MRLCCVVPLFLMVGCSSGRVVRLETGLDSFIVTPREEPGAELKAAELGADDFEQAIAELARDVRPFRHPMQEARALFGVPSRSGTFQFEPRGQRLIPQRQDVDGPRLLETYADEELTRAYGEWCARRRTAGDCLRLLDEGPLLGSDGKYTLAMAIAMDGVWTETAEALEGMVDPDVLQATVLASVTMYMLLWSLPEPISKGLAATLTAAAIAYLGVDTVLRLIDGWVLLVRKVDSSRTFAQLSEAAGEYGEVLGENAARVFVMLATAAIGSTAGLAAKSVGLPGSAQAALAVEAQAGFSYAALGGVQSVAATTTGLTVVLVPTAVAMSARAPRGGSRPHQHHLATDKNGISSVRGGPWTPRFRHIFQKAGMELKDPENIVPLKGHRGPHPQRYHELVFEELDAATLTCRTVLSCRAALQGALRRLAREVATPGTELNLLVTRGATP
ncbi:AHH domain-containing protein [Myxococcus sp. CA040A]|uniref:AHH domain-containing protein n=1 Tax=Myxococcus sp. CA040A TaxID=2741738 RepID=UPI00157ADCD3|nr:AHH domain-containing protein [Myxococcus sp. CA040A]NTX05675.1 AHH domain-containing protein [Myxococcus sp. CA040A]